MMITKTQQGFTLVEIISVLVILGILVAVAVPKYYDLQKDAERKSALAAVAEAQSRIHLRFGQLLLQGETCEDATSKVNTLAALQDASDGQFGEFLLSAEQLTTTGTSVFAKRLGSTGAAQDTGAKLYIPQCNGSTYFASFGNAADMAKIIKIMQEEAQDTSRGKIHSGAIGIADSHASNVVAELKKMGINLTDMATTWTFNNKYNALYWTNKSIDKLSIGASIPVMKYNVKDGIYSVWSASIGSSTLDGKEYNVIDYQITGKEYSKELSQEQKKDYTTVLNIFNTVNN